MLCSELQSHGLAVDVVGALTVFVGLVGIGTAA